MDKTLCFTGHRPSKLCKYDTNKYTKFHKQLTDYLDKLYDEGYRNFISGGAQGFDQIAFWAVNTLQKKHPDIKNIVYVPFDGQEQRWADEGLFSKKQYRLMLKLATDVKMLTSFNTLEEKQKFCTNKQKVVTALMNRNDKMVDASELVIALCNDDWKTSRGGTAECIRYANKKTKDIRIITFDTDSTGLSIKNITPIMNRPLPQINKTTVEETTLHVE